VNLKIMSGGGAGWDHIPADHIAAERKESEPMDEEKIDVIMWGGGLAGSARLTLLRRTASTTW
jgi:hypothetical protein